MIPLEQNEMKSILDGIAAMTDKANSQLESIVQYHSRDELVKALQERRKKFNLPEAHSRYCQTLANQALHYRGWLMYRQEYKRWHSVPPARGVVDPNLSSPAILCVEGDRGFGKTVELFCAKSNLEYQYGSAGRNTAVLYFFFKTGNDELQNSLKALEALLCQLLDLLPGLRIPKEETAIAAVIEILDSQRQGVIGGHRAENKPEASATNEGIPLVDGKPMNGLDFYTTLIRSIVEACSLQVFIILDAVDECRDCIQKDLVTFLETLTCNQNGTIQILMSTRSRSAIDPAMSEPGAYDKKTKTSQVKSAGMTEVITVETEYIRITEENNRQSLITFTQDKIGPLINKRVSSSATTSTNDQGDRIPEVEDIIVEVAKTIVEKVKGDFSYASMVIGNLEQPSRLSLRKRLKNLPTVAKMGEFYYKALEALTKEQRSLIVFALRWVVWSVSTITTTEIAQHYKEMFLDESEDSDEWLEPLAGGVDTRDPDIIEIINHLQTAGRDFFTFGKDGSIDTPRSVQEWIKEEAKLRSENGVSVMISDLPLPTINMMKSIGGKITFELGFPANYKPETRESDLSELFDEKLSHLQITLSILKTLCNSRFYRRYMPWLPPNRHRNFWQSQETKDGVKYTDENDSRSLSETKGHSRYEVKHWQDHIRVLQEWWPLETLEDGLWSEIKIQLSRFTSPKIWNRWCIQRRLGEDKTVDLAYDPICIQNPFQVACKFGLHLLMDLEIAKAPKDQNILTAVDGAWRTPFTLAATRPLTVRHLVEKGADVNQTSKEEPRCPLLIVLYLAALGDDENKQYLETARYLVSKGADLTVKEILSPVKGATPLLYAAKLRDIELTKAIIEAGTVDINHRDIRGAAVLHYLFWKSTTATSVPLRDEATASDSSIAKIFNMLLEAGADVNAQDNASRAPLSWAIEFGDEEGVKLLSNPTVSNIPDKKEALAFRVDINDIDEVGQTCLHDLARRVLDQKCDASILKVLASAGADFSMKTKTGETPLLKASRIHSPHITNDFIIYSCDRPDRAKILQEVDIYGRNILHNISGRLKADWVPVAKKLQGLLEQYRGKDAFPKLCNESDVVSGYTPLHIAASLGNLPMVRFLTTVDTFGKQQDGTTSLTTPLRICIRKLESINPLNEEETSPIGSDQTSKRIQQCLLTIFDVCGAQDTDILPLREVALRLSWEPLIRRLQTRDLLQPNVPDEYGWNAYHIIRLARTATQLSRLSSTLDEHLQRYHEPPFGPSKFDVDRKGDHVILINDKKGCSHDHTRSQLVLANRPIPYIHNKNNFYFEVTFLTKENSGSARCSIGLQTTATHSYDKMVGYQHGIGYHGDDGSLVDSLNAKHFAGFRDHKAPFGQTKKTVVGCGINMEHGIIYFTLNGNFLGEAAQLDRTIRYIPAVSMRSNSEVALINFGSEEFLFDLQKDLPPLDGGGRVVEPKVPADRLRGQREPNGEYANGRISNRIYDGPPDDEYADPRSSRGTRPPVSYHFPAGYEEAPYDEPADPRSSRGTKPTVSHYYERENYKSSYARQQEQQSSGYYVNERIINRDVYSEDDNGSKMDDTDYQNISYGLKYLGGVSWHRDRDRDFSRSNNYNSLGYLGPRAHQSAYRKAYGKIPMSSRYQSIPEEERSEMSEIHRRVDSSSESSSESSHDMAF
ncbi:hypothetical protein AA313_de0209394 [Arthrobotrys entomopaga]|nr:hypothetical protein AA313_de0209394 [Arthrobotrys entomopaga]